MSRQERTAPGRSRRRRVDAERSIEAILDAALDHILAGGDLNMAAIARTAGVSRVTLYAHFPTREALLAGATDRALSLADHDLSEVSLDGAAPDALSRLLRSSWRSLDRYRNLHAVASAVLPPPRLRTIHDRVFGRVEHLVARGQAEGAFRTDLPPDWLLATIYALMHQAAEEVTAGRLPAERAGDILTTTVLSALASAY